MCAPTFRLSTNGGVPYLHSENVAPKYPLSSRKKTGRKMQAKAEPLREGVVVIKEGYDHGRTAGTWEKIPRGSG